MNSPIIQTVLKDHFNDGDLSSPVGRTPKLGSAEDLVGVERRVVRLGPQPLPGYELRIRDSVREPSVHFVDGVRVVVVAVAAAVVVVGVGVGVGVVVGVVVIVVVVVVAQLFSSALLPRAMGGGSGDQPTRQTQLRLVVAGAESVGQNRCRPPVSFGCYKLQYPRFIECSNYSQPK